MEESKMGLIDTIKRIRVKKREKHPKKKIIKNEKTKNKTKTEPIKINEVKYDKKKSKNRMFFGLRIKYDEKSQEDFEEKKEKKQKIRTIESKKTNSIIFDHELTEFEYKLRYLNLKDIHIYNKKIVETALQNKGIKLVDNDLFSNKNNQHEFFF